MRVINYQPFPRRRLGTRGIAAIVVARRIVYRPARARALARLARLAARGPAPRSRTAPIRERRRGAAAALTYLLYVRAYTRPSAVPRFSPQANLGLKTNRAKIDYEDHAVGQARLGDVQA